MMKIDWSMNGARVENEYSVRVRLAPNETVRFEVETIDGTQAVGWAMGDLSSYSKLESEHITVGGNLPSEQERVCAVESALLGFMRDHPHDIGVVYATKTLKIDDFKFLRHQFVFGAIQELIRRGEDVNTKTIVAECDNITSGLHSSYWVPMWFVDSLGGDFDPVVCFTEILLRRISADQ